MIIRLNDHPLEVNLDGVKHLGDLFERIKGEHFAPRDFVSSFSVNGELVEEAQQKAALNLPIADIQSLDMVTDNIRTLSLRTLDNMGQVVDALLSELEESADKFRVDDEKEANRHFVRAVDVLQTFVDVVVKIKSLNSLDYSTIRTPHGLVSEKEQGLLEIFNSILDTQRSKDWVSLADVLEYELIPMVTEWREIFPAISSAIRSLEN